MPDGPHLRTGRPGDVEPAVAGWRTAQAARRGEASFGVDDTDRVRGYLAKADSFFVVAEGEDNLIGMALGMQALEDDGAGPPIPGLCHISMVFVHPAHWGQGIAKLLMHELMSEGRRRGHNAFQLWTQADNERARRLYAGLGFALSGREKDDDLGERVVHFTWRS